MDNAGVKNIVFTSSVAIYGLNKTNPDENHPQDPFNHYGKSKWEAEKVIKSQSFPFHMDIQHNQPRLLLLPFFCFFGKK